MTSVHQLETETSLGIPQEISEPANKNQGNSLNMAVAGQGRKKFIVCAIGTFVSYFYYGILQEAM